MKTSARENSLSALWVGRSEADRSLLTDIFHKAGWQLFAAHQRRQALSCLARNPVQVVIGEKELPDWNWRKMLGDLRLLSIPPQLIVASRDADDYLWAEALNEGAYDVLSQPLDRDEVERVVAAARRHYGPLKVSVAGA
jgi:two-component system, NtrC family, response regulator AtoC